MRTSRNYYEILGLPKTASAEDIRAKHRELVRKYHPDVARDKEMAHRLFIQIQEAYKTLSDPSRRSEYDKQLAEEAHAAAKPYQATAQAQAQPQSAGKTPSQLIKDAQWAFIHKRFHTAMEISKDVLKLDPNNAKAYVIIGDVLRAQHKSDAAANAYAQALQLDPNDRAAERKYFEVTGRHKKVVRGDVIVSAPSKNLLFANVVGWSVAILLIFLMGVYPGKPISWLTRSIPSIDLWSYNFIGFLSASSIVIGALLAGNGMIGSPSDELSLKSDNGLGATFAGILLILGSVFFFPAAAVIYIVLALAMGSISRSVLTVFGCVLAIVLLSTLMYEHEATGQVLLFGGNVAFISILIGWFVGYQMQSVNEF